jgi:uncharacterized membrane protein HdeD (DUF308 family)
MTELMTSSQGTERRARWYWFLALGVLLLLLGLASAGATTWLELTSLLVFGPLLLVSSLVQFLTALFSETGKERLLHYVAAGLEMILGFFIMAHPLQTVGDLIGLIAIFFIVIGLVRLARAFAGQSDRRAWPLVAGIVALVVGICILIGRPVERLWLVGLFIAIDFLCHGLSWSALALAERKPLQDKPT